MNKVQALISQLKSKSHRITPVRHALVELFSQCPCAVSLSDITEALAANDLHPNKTTLYRELDFLVDQQIIQEIDFGEGKKRYELAGNHHHHLICTGCKSIEEITLPDHLHEHEKQIFKNKHFKVTRHMLEFFGLCRRCHSQEAH